MTATFDPEAMMQKTFVHPTREQMDNGYHHPQARVQLDKKLLDRLNTGEFKPQIPYYATLVLHGVSKDKESQAIATAFMLVGRSKWLGFLSPKGVTLYFVYSGRPLIGLIATDAPLDRDEAMGHFPPSGSV